MYIYIYIFICMYKCILGIYIYEYALSHFELGIVYIPAFHYIYIAIPSLHLSLSVLFFLPIIFHGNYGFPLSHITSVCLPRFIMCIFIWLLHLSISMSPTKCKSLRHKLSGMINAFTSPKIGLCCWLCLRLYIFAVSQITWCGPLLCVKQRLPMNVVYGRPLFVHCATIIKYLWIMIVQYTFLVSKLQIISFPHITWTIFSMTWDKIRTVSLP